jgi:IPT/TIG domain-containing protein
MTRSKRIRSLATGAAAVLLAGAAAAPAQAAGTPVLAMVLSGVSGPSGGGNQLTGTVQASTNNPTPFAAGTVPIVQFQFVGAGAASCSTAPKSVQQIAAGTTTATATTTTAGVLTVNPSDVTRLSGVKIGFVVPSAAYPAQVDGSTSTVNPDGLVLLAGQTTSKWNVCVYDSNPSTTTSLLANSAYALAIRPKITAILPLSSPAAGGQLITVNGVGFSVLTNGTTVTVGGVALKDVRVAGSGNSLTGTTQTRAAEKDLALVVSTTGGVVTSIDPDNNGLPPDDSDTTFDTPLLFTYRNGISVAPDNAPAGAKVSLDIKGVAFDALTFSNSPTAVPTDATAHVFLVKDAYDPATNRGVQECKNVRLVSSTELLCALDLSADRLNPADSTTVPGTPVTEATYTVTVVANGAPSADAQTANASIVSAGSTFTVSPF